MRNLFNENIVAFLPVYKEGLGNVVELYLEDRRIYIELAIKSFLSNLMNYHMVNSNELNRCYGHLFTIRRNLPIPFSREDILVPIKCRRPRVKNDGAYGYVNLRHIEGSFYREGQLYLRTKSYDIAVKSSLACLESSITRARVMSAAYVSKSFYREKED